MLPVIHGMIDRRMLLNYRVEPEVVSQILPQPFRPKLVHDCAIAGICLIRLKHIRPRGLPSCVGLRSENAAHRIAVEWEADGTLRQGVYIPRRDTSSRLNALLGGRIFPGVHHHATFCVAETADRFELEMQSDDGKIHLAIRAAIADDFSTTSCFESTLQASQFFERGSIGYSASADASRFDGLELRTHGWAVDPLSVQRVESSFFDNQEIFPEGAAQFDCALLMRNVRHEWHSHVGQVLAPAVTMRCRTQTGTSPSADAHVDIVETHLSAIPKRT